MSEFDDIARRLEDHRPEASPLELDAMKLQARRRAAIHPGRNQSMKSRLAIIATLSVGMVFSTAGAGLAISGLSGSGNAGVAQYGTPTPTPTETATPTPTAPAPQPVAPTPAPTVTAQATPTPSTGNVAGETESNSPSDTGDTAPAEDTPSGGVQGEQETQPSSNVQPAAQVEAGNTSGNELPFTGFAAIPVILVGALLLTVGMVMRRRNSDD